MPVFFTDLNLVDIKLWLVISQAVACTFKVAFYIFLNISSGITMFLDLIDSIHCVRSEPERVERVPVFEEKITGIVRQLMLNRRLKIALTQCFVNSLKQIFQKRKKYLIFTECNLIIF